MKKRRTLIISLLLVAALALGVGYAAFSSEMMVNGEANLNATASLVHFCKAETITGTSDGVSIVAEGLETKSLSLDVNGFSKVGDKAVIKITVANPHDFAVTISDYTGVLGIDRQNESGTFYFTVEDSDDFGDGTVIPAAASATTPSEVTFTITVTCNATSASVVNENFEIKFKANAQ